MYLPTVAGTVLFVMAGFDLSGLMNFIATLVLLVLTAIPFQYSYHSLFPVEPARLREARIALSLLFFTAQALFWVALFVTASYLEKRHGT